MLYQKAELKKNYIKKVNDNSQKIKSQFIETYNNFLNKSLTSNLIQAKEAILNLKNKLLDDLKQNILKKLEEIITRNYDNYLDYLIKSIKSSLHMVDKPPKVVILLNQKDFDVFNKNPSKIQSLFKNKIEIALSNNQYMGGFTIILEDGKIIYNFTLDNLIEKNFIIIERQFSLIFSEVEIEKLQTDFEEYIKIKKQEIMEYLKKYDQI